MLIYIHLNIKTVFMVILFKYSFRDFVLDVIKVLVDISIIIA
jgi:hypothetical protein